ncbi:ATP-binding protein [Microbacterium sp. PA5]|uniref:ATP-binding protein n=1 Tax=Microbacterium sp. PA5 TaxID=3416654 RepID=UPI003CEFCC14
MAPTPETDPATRESTLPPALRVHVLGAVRAWRDGSEVDLGGPRCAGLLAVLIARAPHPVSTAELVALLWGEAPPASAVNTIHRYVGTLRRVLEPGLPLRATGTLLRGRAGGYSWAGDDDHLTSDLRSFRVAVHRAARAAQLGERRDALADYAAALELWSGPAGDDVRSGAHIQTLFATIDNELYDAAVAATRIAVEVGRPQDVVQSVSFAASLSPLHEPLQSSLVTLLAAAGLQSEALALYHRVRDRLKDDLGVDPSPVLQAAFKEVLAGAPTATTRDRNDVRVARSIVGREAERSAVRSAVDDALSGASSILLFEGEPGIGKTQLLDFAAELAQREGATVVRGRCIEGAGAPAMHPWLQITESLLRDPTAGQETRAGLAGVLRLPEDAAPLAFVLPDLGTQFRLFEAITALLTQAAAHRAVVVILDDLHWADTATSEMLTHLSNQLPTGVAIFGAFRDRAPAPDWELVRTLAHIGRHPRSRRYKLAPFQPSETASLIRQEAGDQSDPSVTERIHARTGGNPFLVRELARMLGDGRLTEPASPEWELPSSVVDIVRDRTRNLPPDARRMLEVAALVGRVVDIQLLAAVCAIDLEACLKHLDLLNAEGLIHLPIADPRIFEFTHDLFREAVLQAAGREGTARLHLAIAAALPQTDAAGEAIADHLWQAGPLADEQRTVSALIRAAEIATSRSAFDTADRRLRDAARLAERSGLLELELTALSRLTAIVGMRAGYVGAAVTLLERAEALARQLGRERASADFLFSRWAAYSQGIDLTRAEPLAERLREWGRSSADPIVQAYGWHAWGFHQWDLGNIDAAFEYLNRANAAAFEDDKDDTPDPLRRDLQLLWPVMLALVTGLHGDVAGAKKQFERSEHAAGDDPYAVTVWSAFSVMTAALAGDVAWVRRASARGIAADPDHSFTFLGSYQRLGALWAAAMLDDDPGGASLRAEAIIESVFADPPRSGLATWYCLLAEMMLRAGRVDEAERALERSAEFMERFDQRYAEALLLLLRAELLAARGETSDVVRTAILRGRELATARGAHLFVHRADSMLSRRHLRPADDNR